MDVRKTFAANGGTSTEAFQSGFYINIVNTNRYEVASATMRISWNVTNINTTNRTGQMNVTMQMTKTGGGSSSVLWFSTKSLKLAGATLSNRSTPRINLNTDIVSTSWNFSYDASGHASVYIGESTISGRMYANSTGSAESFDRVWTVPGFTVYPDMIDPAYVPPSGLSLSNLSAEAWSISGTLSVGNWGVGYNDPGWYYKVFGLSEAEDDCCTIVRIAFGDSSSTSFTANAGYNFFGDGTQWSWVRPNDRYWVWGYADNFGGDSGTVRLGSIVTLPAAGNITGIVSRITNSSAQVYWDASMAYNPDVSGGVMYGLGVYSVYNGIQVRPSESSGDWIECSSYALPSGESYCMGLEPGTLYDARTFARSEAGTTIGEVTTGLFTTRSDFGGEPAPILEMSVSTNQLEFDVSPDGELSTSAPLSIMITTDNPDGYDLGVQFSSDETCLRHLTSASEACSSINTNSKFSQIPTVTAEALSIGEYALKRDSQFAQIPAASDTPLNLKSVSETAVNDNTQVSFGARGNMDMRVGKYKTELTITTMMNLPAEPTITSISPINGPLSGGTDVRIIGTNFETAYDVTVDGVSCSEIYRIDDNELSCITPEGTAAGIVDLAVETWGGTATIDFKYLEPVSEMWGFTIDTVQSTNIGFSALNSTAMEVDFGTGEYTHTFAAGNYIFGTAVPSDGTLAHIRIRPVDDTVFNWLPIPRSEWGSAVLCNNLLNAAPADYWCKSDDYGDNGIGPVRLISFDYPITTQSISTSAGVIQDYTLYYAFPDNSSINDGGNWHKVATLTAGLSFANTAPVNTIGARFLSGALSDQESITTPTDLSGLADLGVTLINGPGFLSAIHSGNTSLTVPIDLSALETWDPIIPIDASSSQGAQHGLFAFMHHLNTSMLDISSFRLPNWAKPYLTAPVAQYIDPYERPLGFTFAICDPMYSQCTPADTFPGTYGAEPKFMDGTNLSSVGSLGHTNWYDAALPYYGRKHFTGLPTGWNGV